MRFMIQLDLIGVPLHHLRNLRALLRNEPEITFYANQDAGSIRLITDETDPDAAVFEEYCRDHRLTSFRSGTWRIYSRRDMEKFQLFELDAGPARFTANWTEFSSVGACPQCGMGETQTGPLLVKIRRAPKREMVYLQAQRTFQWIISARLAEQLRSYTGLRLGEVRNVTRGEVVRGCYQLIVDNTLPRMTAIAEFSEFDPPLKNRCSCNRNGWNLKTEMVYERAALDTAKDFNLTMEYFYGGGYGHRHYVVSHRVRQLFRELKIRVFFRPVQIVEPTVQLPRKFEMPLDDPAFLV